jgi:hypothetical protein
MEYVRRCDTPELQLLYPLSNHMQLKPAVLGPDKPGSARAVSLQHPHHHRRIEDVPALFLTLRAVGLLWPCKPHNSPEGAGHQALGPSRTESALVGLQHQVHQSTVFNSTLWSCHQCMSSVRSNSAPDDKFFPQHFAAQHSTAQQHSSPF